MVLVSQSECINLCCSRNFHPGWGNWLCAEKDYAIGALVLFIGSTKHDRQTDHARGRAKICYVSLSNLASIAYSLSTIFDRSSRVARSPCVQRSSNVAYLPFNLLCLSQRSEPCTQNPPSSYPASRIFWNRLHQIRSRQKIALSVPNVRRRMRQSPRKYTFKSPHTSPQVYPMRAGTHQIRQLTRQEICESNRFLPSW
jgi:hypothetical protein